MSDSVVVMTTLSPPRRDDRRVDLAKPRVRGPRYRTPSPCHLTHDSVLYRCAAVSYLADLPADQPAGNASASPQKLDIRVSLAAQAPGRSLPPTLK